MTSLNKDQKQLLFDYCSNLASAEQQRQAQSLLSSDDHAKAVCTKLSAFFSLLNSDQQERCPENLAQGTVFRLAAMAESKSKTLTQLLQSEQNAGVPVKTNFWRNLGQVVAAAAVIMFVSGIVIAPLNQARQHYFTKYCANNLAQIGRGIVTYKADNDGQMPSVATAVGSPWWKVGDQGEQNQSNTRHLWLLIKNGYVDLNDFICPASTSGIRSNLTADQIDKLNDFPNRNYVTYSFRIKCPRASDSTSVPRPLVADMNPLFESLPGIYSAPFNLKLDERLSSINSFNHRRKGQNILFCDGSVTFQKTRKAGLANDDIFTIQNTSLYKGTETPNCQKDTFLAP